MAQILFRAAYLEVPHQLGSGNRLAAAPGIARIGIENRQPFRGREVNFEALNLKPRSPQAALSILKPTQHRQIMRDELVSAKNRPSPGLTTTIASS
jgi:hypothetical protein